MQRAGLIIFIDGLGYLQARREHLFEFLSDKRPVIPGFGYSVNIQTELFAGASPDEAGFFCDWTYVPEGSKYRRYATPLRALAGLVKPWKALDVFVHRVMNRFLFSSLAIPFDYLPWFGQQGRYIFETGDSDVLRACRLISYAGVPGGLGEKDEWVFQEAQEKLQTEGRPLCITFVDLDHLGHREGPDGPAFQAKLSWLNEHVRVLAESLWAKHASAPVVVVSDHGWSVVREVRSVGLERVLGPPSPDRYTYFVDSTLVRVWTHVPKVKAQAESYLESIAVVIGPDERAEFGIRSDVFGDVIAVAPDGVVFSPNFHSGRVVPAAMHGYHPREPSQYGLWGAANVAVPVQREELRASDVYAQLKELFVV